MKQLLNLQEIETAVDEYGDIVISKDDENSVVFMSIQEYNEKILENEIERKILQSEEDYKAGRTRNASEVFKVWKEKYGI